MRFLQWLGVGPARIQTQDSYTKRSRATGGEEITIEWHEADKQQTLQEIEYQRGLKAQFAKLKWEPARVWNMQDRDNEINRLERSIQWNEQSIIHARNNILFRQHQ